MFGFIDGGNEAGITVANNVSAFSRIGFMPRVASNQAPRALATNALGTPLAMPVVPTPAGFIRIVHPDGELGVARAAQKFGLPMGLSILSSAAIEDVCAVNEHVWFQVYMIGGRSGTAEVIARAQAAGASALIVTVDLAAGTGGNDKGKSVPPPAKISAGAALRFAPQGMRHPRWTAQLLRGGLELRAPNVPGADGKAMTIAEGSAALREHPPTWDDISYIRALWNGPLMVKGIVSPEDARIAAGLGVDAISVSNHGGNGLDGAPATIEALPAVVEACGDAVEVLMDGGVRRGPDVVKALALGARAIMMGRPYIWALAAGGQHGVEEIFAAFHKGITGTLVLLDVESVHDVSPAHLRLG